MNDDQQLDTIEAAQRLPTLFSAFRFVSRKQVEGIKEDRNRFLKAEAVFAKARMVFALIPLESKFRHDMIVTTLRRLAVRF